MGEGEGEERMTDGTRVSVWKRKVTSGSCRKSGMADERDNVKRNGMSHCEKRLIGPIRREGEIYQAHEEKGKHGTKMERTKDGRWNGWNYGVERVGELHNIS